jgi:hypothetical protein
MASILILERDFFLGGDLGAFLRHHGHEPICVVDCAEATRCLHERARPDVAVVDPSSQESESCADLVLMLAEHSIPVIVWSLLPDPVQFDRLKSLGLALLTVRPGSTYDGILWAVDQQTRHGWKYEGP